MDGHYKKFKDYFQLLESRGVASELVEQGRLLNEEIKVKFDKNDNELNHLRTLLDHVPCTISHISSDLSYLAVNKFLADSFGVKPQEFIGKKVGFKSEHQYFSTFTKNFFNSPDDFTSHEVESQVNGESKYFFVQGIKINEGKEALIIGIDITELTLLKDTVVFLDRLSSVGEMMAGILHEISNPLMLIRNYGSKLQKMSHHNDFDTDKIAKSADVICRTSEKIEKIVAGIKAFVRMSDDNERKETPFITVLDDAALICESLFHENGVEFRKLQESWPSVMMNETQIFQVFVNLLTNACHAIESNDEKWIEVDFKEEKDCYKFSVTDSGHGIPQEVREKMFSSFYTTKGVGKGTGLGLSLCFKIVENHQGHIYVDKAHAHTRFVVELPK